MTLLSLAAVLLIGLPWLAYLVTLGVLLLNRAPGHDLPLLPWFPSWDPEAYDDVGQRWLPWHKRAAIVAFLGSGTFVLLAWLVR